MRNVVIVVVKTQCVVVIDTIRGGGRDAIRGGGRDAMHCVSTVRGIAFPRCIMYQQ